jgi:hypothetical protein
MKSGTRVIGEKKVRLNSGLVKVLITKDMRLERWIYRR